MKIRTIFKEMTFIGVGLIGGDIIWRNAPKKMTIFGALSRFIGGTMVGTVAAFEAVDLVDKAADEMESIRDQVKDAVAKAVNGVASAAVAKAVTEVKNEVKHVVNKLAQEDESADIVIRPYDADTLVVDKLDPEEVGALYTEIKDVVPHFGIYNGRDLRMYIEEHIGHINIQLGRFSLAITEDNISEVRIEPSLRDPGKWRIKLPGYNGVKCD